LEIADTAKLSTGISYAAMARLDKPGVQSAQ
jgi:hypothetical protein